MQAEMMHQDGQQQQQWQMQCDMNQQACQQKTCVHQSSYMHTEVRTPYMHLPQPFISSSAMAKDLVGEGFHASISSIRGSSNDFQVGEFPELDKEAQVDLEAKMREQDAMAKQFEKEIERRTEMYRKQQEVETDKIRKELEKQHMKDVEFRKELMEMAIENQKRQIDMEARFAKKELERERTKARMTLDRSRFHTDIQVNMESAVGGTQSGGQVVSESEKMTEQFKQSQIRC